MKSKHLIALLVFVFGGFVGGVFAQKGSHSLTRENISLTKPEGWLATKLGKKYGDYGVRVKKNNDVAFVEINCQRRAIEPTSRITTLASQRSNKPTFEYMQIDKLSDSKLDRKNAKLLVYTNAYLIDTYRGGIYGLVDNGYTYTVEYYGADTPEQRAELDKILRSIKIAKPLAEENIVEMAEGFVSEDWNMAEEDETEAVVAPAEKAQKVEKQKEEKVELTKEEKKLEKEKAKRLKEETKKVEKRKKELEKKKQELEKERKAARKQELKEERAAAKEREKALKAKQKEVEKQKKAEEKKIKEAEKLKKEEEKLKAKEEKQRLKEQEKKAKAL